MIQKSMIIPLVSAICLLLQATFHTSIPQELQDAISTVVTDLFFLGFTVYGIMKDHNSNTKG